MRSWAEVVLPPLPERFSLPPLALFNTASQAIEVLKEKPLYRIYVCGITPYDATHIGHAATYLTFDLINRYLRTRGAKVNFVQNITDIDDPLLERANRDQVDWQELAQSQIELFRADMVDLHVLPPAHYIGVVEAMQLVTAAISELERAKTTYLVENDLYFKVRSDNEFGERSHLSGEQMLSIFSERGGDPTRAGKIDPLDALLWLAKREGEPSWPSSFGQGRPGWHIECCAIALHYLQPDSSEDFALDIQGGGSDLIFPHHEMSAAQSRAIRGQRFASMYIHAGMIGLNGEKMSKSKGNLIFVSELTNSGVNPMAIRWALMKGHYRADRMWSNELINDSIFELSQLQIALSRIEVAPTDNLIEGVVRALADNLDTPTAISQINDWVLKTLQGADGGNAGELARAIDRLLGIAL